MNFDVVNLVKDINIFKKTIVSDLDTLTYYIFNIVYKRIYDKYNVNNCLGLNPYMRIIIFKYEIYSLIKSLNYFLIKSNLKSDKSFLDKYYKVLSPSIFTKQLEYLLHYDGEVDLDTDEFEYDYNMLRLLQKKYLPNYKYLNKGNIMNTSHESYEEYMSNVKYLHINLEYYQSSFKKEEVELIIRLIKDKLLRKHTNKLKCDSLYLINVNNLNNYLGNNVNTCTILDNNYNVMYNINIPIKNLMLRQIDNSKKEIYTDKYCLDFVNKIYGVVLNINPLSIKCIKLYYPVEYFDYLLPKLYLTSAFKRLLQKNITKY